MKPFTSLRLGALVALALPSLAAAIQIQVVPAIDPAFDATAVGVSNDGIVVGNNVGTAYRWAGGSTSASLPKAAGGTSNYATGISADGHTVSGASSVNWYNRAAIWDNTGLHGSGPAVGPGEESMTRAVSADGRVAVGGISRWQQPAMAYRVANGVSADLGVLTPGGMSQALAVSGDGTTVVGQATSTDNNTRVAFRWNAVGGMVALGRPMPGGESSANAVSGDGRTIVGWAMTPGGVRAYRWSDGGSMTDLGLLGGSYLPTSRAFGVSGDGSLIVGQSTTATGTEAFLWTATSGMVGLRDYLSLNGVDSSAWLRLDTATAISANGRYVVGTGTLMDGAQRGFRIDLAPVPEPASMAALAVGLAALRRRKRAKM